MVIFRHITLKIQIFFNYLQSKNIVNIDRKLRTVKGNSPNLYKDWSSNKILTATCL